jgi:hypothetical protein
MNHHEEILLAHLTKFRGQWCATKQIKQSTGLGLSDMNRAIDGLKLRNAITGKVVAGRRVFMLKEDGSVAGVRANPDWRSTTLEDHGAVRRQTNLAMLSRR